MQLASIAHKLNLPFFPEGDDSLLERLNHFHLLSQGHSDEIWNMLHGETNNVELAVFDYSFECGSGEKSNIAIQNVIYFRSAKLNLPQFALRPENVFHKIGVYLVIRTSTLKRTLSSPRRIYCEETTSRESVCYSTTSY